MRNKALVILAASALLAPAIALPAKADLLIPLNDPPTVANLKLPTAIQPAYPRSTSAYSVIATVGSQGTVANLKTVSMCWYKGSTSSTCEDAASNPDTQFQMIWTEATNSFSITGTNDYRDAGSTTSYADGSGLTMDVEFKFRASGAMLFGDDWNVTVLAVDQQDQGTQNDPVFSSELTANGLVVLFFGSVRTQPASKSFGNIKKGESSKIENVSTGSFTANGLADISIEATDFKYSSSTIELDELNRNPGTGKVSLTCNAGSSYSASNSILVGNSPQLLITGEFGSGTLESTGTTQPHSCQLEYGGGAAVANVEYSNTLTVSIHQSQ